MSVCSSPSCCEPAEGDPVVDMVDGSGLTEIGREEGLTVGEDVGATDDVAKVVSVTVPVGMVPISVVDTVGLEQPQDTENSSVVTSTESLVESVKP